MATSINILGRLQMGKPTITIRVTNCDTDHYLVVANVREILEVNKQKLRRFHIERINPKKLKEVECKDQ
jgi:hypothetical protein